MKKVIDLGCGPNKIKGAFGVDNFNYPGVDVVCDLNNSPWPIEDNQFDEIWAREVIEHIQNISSFLSEIHRIGRKNAEVHITTPHYSSSESWGDPTHNRHLGVRWHSCVSRRDSNYMTQKLPKFELVSNQITFIKPQRLRNLITRFVIWIDGLTDWDKKWCFIFRGGGIYTVLKIIK